MRVPEGPSGSVWPDRVPPLTVATLCHSGDTPSWDHLGSGDMAMVMVAPQVAPLKMVEGQGASRGWADLINQAGSGWRVAGRPRPQGGGHWGHTQQTGRDHSSALPCCRTASPPAPAQPPGPGPCGHCASVQPEHPETPGTAPGRAESRGGTRGHSREWGRRGAARGAPPASCHPQPFAAPSPQLAALV